ncbi:protein CURVATURE THYLAKOID 1B, chloroplastic-like isoform X3 [Elaeis guineensis]|uniref:protein CURVATURE THYLAKOID 1B, chloroplastic-like isoform X3 n=1 Tax=Elaeis guineensis var. tenera TaxID=51953 RepID=UPI003C6D75A8
MATGDTPAEVVTEVPEIVKSIQAAWDRLEDKHAVTSLAFVGAIALWSTSGMISEIDRLPVVPGALELAGIGYTGWFAYRDLVFKPDREALIAKIKNICYDIIGRS